MSQKQKEQHKTQRMCKAQLRDLLNISGKKLRFFARKVSQCSGKVVNVQTVEK